jgi:hypothetical protein
MDHEPIGMRAVGVHRRRIGIFTLGALLTGLSRAQTAPARDTRFPDVVSAKVRAAGKGCYDFDVTISSPYDTPQRYADGFRVVAPSGDVLGERTLWHDHQNEQPFTRDLYGVPVPAGIHSVRTQARDQKYGYGGKSIEVVLPVTP